MLPTDRGAQRLKGLRKVEVEGFFDWLQDYWFWLEESQKFASEVRAVCRGRLIDWLGCGLFEAFSLGGRSGRWHWKCSINFARCRRWVSLDRNRHADFTLVQQVAHWGDQEVEDFRAQYVNRLKDQFSTFFDQVESNPLSESQRDACVIDEDNNSGAGRCGHWKNECDGGARGVFWLGAGQARPDEILMLAFANKAATRDAGATG